MIIFYVIIVDENNALRDRFVNGGCISNKLPVK